MDTKEPRTWNVLGEHVVCKAGTGDTDGVYSLFEAVSPPGGGPPLHVHEREDEAFYIIDGTFLVQLGERKFRAAAGDFVRFPRGTAHAYKNVGDRPARLMVIVSPAGYERFFEAMAKVPMTSTGMPDFAQVAATARQHGVEVIGPPLVD